MACLLMETKDWPVNCAFHKASLSLATEGVRFITKQSCKYLWVGATWFVSLVRTSEKAILADPKAPRTQISSDSLFSFTWKSSLGAKGWLWRDACNLQCCRHHQTSGRGNHPRDTLDMCAEVTAPGQYCRPPAQTRWADAFTPSERRTLQMNVTRRLWLADPRRPAPGRCGEVKAGAGTRWKGW